MSRCPDQEMGRFRLAVWACLVWNLFNVGRFWMLEMHLAPGFLQPVVEWLDGLPLYMLILREASVYAPLAGAGLMLLRSRHAAVAFVIGFAASAACYSQIMLHHFGDPRCTLLVQWVLAVRQIAIGVQWWLARRMFWAGYLD